MTIKEKKYLSDMMRAISLIESFTANTRSYMEYTVDKNPKWPGKCNLAL